MIDSPIRLEWVEHLSLARTRLGRLELFERARTADSPALPFQLVKEVLQAQVAALDSTARAIGERIQRRDVKRMPYYPKARRPEGFIGVLQSQLPALPRQYPEIVEACRRHQPFVPGKEHLAVLFDLAAIRRAANLPLDVDTATGTAVLVLDGRPALPLLEQIQALVEDAVADLVQTAGLPSGRTGEGAAVGQ